MPDKKPRKLTRKQQKLVEGIIAGKSGAQAARDAGYSPNNARQSAYQAMKEIGERVRQAMDRHGLDLDQLIDKHLHPLLEATETKLFPWRKTTKRKTEQVHSMRSCAKLVQMPAPKTLLSGQAPLADRGQIKRSTYRAVILEGGARRVSSAQTLVRPARDSGEPVRCARPEWESEARRRAELLLLLA